MQKNKTEILIQKYLSHQLNEQEFEELKQWIEKGEFGVIVTVYS